MSVAVAVTVTPAARAPTGGSAAVATSRAGDEWGSRPRGARARLGCKKLCQEQDPGHTCSITPSRLLCSLFILSVSESVLVRSRASPSRACNWTSRLNIKDFGPSVTQA